MDPTAHTHGTLTAKRSLYCLAPKLSLLRCSQFTPARSSWTCLAAWPGSAWTRLTGWTLAWPCSGSCSSPPVPSSAGTDRCTGPSGDLPLSSPAAFSPVFALTIFFSDSLTGATVLSASLSSSSCISVSLAFTSCKRLGSSAGGRGDCFHAFTYSAPLPGERVRQPDSLCLCPVSPAAGSQLWLVWTPVSQWASSCCWLLLSSPLCPCARSSCLKRWASDQPSLWRRWETTTIIISVLTSPICSASLLSRCTRCIAPLALVSRRPSRSSQPESCRTKPFRPPPPTLRPTLRPTPPVGPSDLKIHKRTHAHRLYGRPQKREVDNSGRVVLFCRVNLLSGWSKVWIAD